MLMDRRRPTRLGVVTVDIYDNDIAAVAAVAVLVGMTAWAAVFSDVVSRGAPVTEVGDDMLTGVEAGSACVAVYGESLPFLDSHKRER